MTARARRREEIRCANPIEVFTARCQARALLFEAGEFDLHEAVDVLQDACGAHWPGDVAWPGRGAGHDGRCAFKATRAGHQERRASIPGK